MTGGEHTALGAAAGPPPDPMPVSTRPTDRGREVRAVGFGVLASWLQIAVGILATPVQTALVLRFLTAGEAGAWLVVLSYVGYLNLLNLGVAPTLTRGVAYRRGRSAASDVPPDDAELHDFVASARRLYVGIVAAYVVVGAAVLPLVVPRATELAEGDAIAAWLLVLSGGAAALLATESYALLAGLGIVGVNRLAQAGAQVAGLVLTYVALRAGLRVPGAAMGWMLQNVLLLAAGVVVVRRLSDLGKRGRGRPRGPLMREALGPSLRTTAVGLGTLLIFAAGPTLIAQSLGAAAVPRFAVLQQLAAALYGVAAVPTTMLAPFISHAHSAGDRARVVSLVERNVRYVAIPLLGGAAFLACFGREVVSAWVGAANFGGYPTLWVLLTLFVLEAHHVIHAGAAFAIGHATFVPQAIIAGVLTVTLGVALLPQLGVLGMAVAMLLAQLATNSWYVPHYTLRLLGIPVRRYARGLLPLAALLAIDLAAAGAASAALTAGHVDRDVVRAAGGFGVVALATLAAAWSLVLDGDERAWLRARLALVRRRLPGAGS